MKIDPPTQWVACPPKTNLDLPKRMSFSTLNEIEACPQRWWLRSSSYPEIWEKQGYPPNPSIPLLTGQILHQSVEKIIKAFNALNTISTNDETFRLKRHSLRGYREILKTELNQIIKNLEKNPRLKNRLGEIEDKLKLCLPGLREQLQNLVSGLHLKTKGKTITEVNNQIHLGRKRLYDGSYSEIELTAEDIGWYGRADYLSLSNEGCEITDIKTGARKPEHELQLHIYNMLWTYDKERNPHSIPVTRLTIAYKDGQVEVKPLSLRELNDFTENLMRRTRAAVDEISREKPLAKPAFENCHYCDVRHLCTAYWDQKTQLQLAQESILASKSQKSFDIEIKLFNAIAPHIWQAKTTKCGSIKPGTDVLVHFTGIDRELIQSFQAGITLRLLNVYWLKQNEDETSFATIIFRSQSEVFHVFA